MKTSLKSGKPCLNLKKKKIGKLNTILSNKATQKKFTLNGAYAWFNAYFEAVVIATFFGGPVAIHV